MRGFKKGELPVNFMTGFIELYIERKPKPEEAYELDNNDLINQILYD